MKEKEKGSLKTRSFICTFLAALGFFGLLLSLSTPFSKDYIVVLADKMMLAKILLSSCLLALVFSSLGWRCDDKMEKLEKT
jgi:hypothetical protein